jgi:hypothetical protein
MASPTSLLIVIAASTALVGCQPAGFSSTSGIATQFGSTPGIECPGIPFEPVTGSDAPLQLERTTGPTVTVSWQKAVSTDTPSGMLAVRTLECVCWTNLRFDGNSGAFLRQMTESWLRSRPRASRGDSARLTKSDFAYINERALFDFEIGGTNEFERLAVFGRIAASRQCLLHAMSYAETNIDKNDEISRKATDFERAWLSKAGIEPPKPAAPAAQGDGNSSPAARLETLRQLRDQRLLSPAEYETRRKAILDSL